MTITKSLLLGSAATLVAVAGAQAADLPSKKAAPATYVKVCDAYGAGFFFIPGTDTCVRLGGYVRVEYQYTPAQNVYRLEPKSITKTELGTGMHASSGTVNSNYMLTGTAAVSSAAGTPDVYVQPKNLQDETGYEVRGRIDVDARTSTSMGVARTFVRLRSANTSGIRNATAVNVFGYANSTGSSSGITIESASVQWAGFTFGVAPQNYAMMPSQIYHANPWTGFPNGMKQIAYTASFGGGLSATVAVEDRADHGGNIVTTNNLKGLVYVGNIRLDQSWGFAAIHAMSQSNTGYSSNGTDWNTSTSSGMLGGSGAQSDNTDFKSKQGYAVGATVSFKLPMIAPGDQLWLTANYADGALGALLSPGGLSSVNNAANHRMIGGLVRVDQNLGAVNSTTLDNVKGWNVAAAFTHYWAKQWRSNFNAGYVEINPPTSTSGITWGKGQLQVYTGSLIYSPVNNLDIGLELQYANIQNKLQASSGTTNSTNNVTLADTLKNAGALKGSNVSAKLRVERSF